MKVQKYKAMITTLAGCLGCAVTAFAFPNPEPEPELLWEFSQHYDIDSEKIFSNPDLVKRAETVDSILRTDTVTVVDIRGYASIDGPVALNRELAKGRAKATANWLTKSTKIDPSLIRITSNGEDWKMFDSLVCIDPDMPMKAELLEIVRSGSNILQKQRAMKALGGGSVWQYLAKYTLPEMRMSTVAINGYKFEVKMDQPEPRPVETVEVVEEVVVEEPVPAETEPLEEPWVHKLYVKTNAPAWLMLWVNAAVEYDLAPHWSVALPIYYSGWNYFTSKLKFRTFSVVPEVRYWLREDNMGFFVNGHLGLNLFNYAKGGEWRYQTYKGHTPALGGGVGLGYRWYFCKNHRWSMEAAVGCGVYRLDYSIFENIHNGLIVGRRQRTFFGIDQAALSFAYSFGVKQKGGKK